MVCAVFSRFRQLRVAMQQIRVGLVTLVGSYYRFSTLATNRRSLFHRHAIMLFHCLPKNVHQQVLKVIQGARKKGAAESTRNRTRMSEATVMPQYETLFAW